MSITSRKDTMMTERHEEIKSTAAINGHPIHPMLIAFPIAFLVGAFVTDVVYAITDGAFWSQASLWLLIAGIATALFAALFGLIDFATIQRVRDHRIAWWHMGLNLLAVALAAINLALRLTSDGDTMPLGLILSAAVTGLLTISGWLGGEMTFRHKIGVNSAVDDLEDTVSHRAYGASD
jgi:uncharacterized membrane protein